MKKLTLTLCAVVAVASASFAGTETYSGKEMKQVETTPCPSWYADNEWNVGLSFIYGANVNDSDDNNFGFNDSWDDGFGGAIDVKYFFRRYFGLGIQGFALSVDRENDRGRFFRDEDDDNFAGGLLGTFTFRYPIPCSRFAPYFWAGAGGYFHDSAEDNQFFGRNDDENNGRFMGQFGAGFEVRFTPHIGWTNDISFNDVEGGEHDFVQVRTGLNFAF